MTAKQLLLTCCIAKQECHDFNTYLTGDFIGMVGVKDGATGRVSLYTHQRFEFEYNGNQVISAKVTPESPLVLTNGQGLNVEFTYSVTWKETQTPFKSRFERYLDSDFFENKVSTCRSRIYTKDRTIKTHVTNPRSSMLV